ncbi:MULTISPECIES: MFS transporter [unclassified Dysgonomonas]|jgi:MFS family permease|uniref:MFS transporter n=1 Tax=unclassified Dysgonomonas TaxID=2630389 RepID=UPI0025BD5C3E|nr:MULTISPECIES: MFS transporter [unclassified Dysgonomonas]MDR2002025.1 MFS transporter [Prevotella sp.]HMM02768.1 MFS transporter [Dysgonomonas sp.]
MKYNNTLVYIAACIGMAFFGIAFIVMGSVLPSLTARYALDTVGASSLVTFLPVGVLLGSLIFGPVVDRFGYKILLITSTISALLGLEGLAFFDNLNILRFCIFLIGFGGGMLNGATNALVSEISDDKNRSSRLSILGVFYGIGALGIPFLLGFLSEYYTYQIILQRTGLFMLLCVIYFIAIKFPEPKFKQGFPIKKALTLIKEPLLLIMSFFLFFQSGLEGLINNWTTSYLEGATNIDKSNVILSLTFFVLGMTIARLLLSYLLHIIKHSRILIGGIIIAMLGIIILNYSSTFYMAATGLFMTGFGIAAGFPVMVGIIGSIYKETTGTAIGIALFIALSGNTILNYVMGHVSKVFEISSFPVSIIILLVLQAIIIFSNTKIINK